jgi:signal peptidase I
MRYKYNPVGRKTFLFAEMNDLKKTSTKEDFKMFKKQFDTALQEGFGTKAKNIARTMRVGDIVVPLCGNLTARQLLANRGIYPGVEFEVCSMSLSNGTYIESMHDISVDLHSDVTVMVKPAYKLRDHLERDDWPVPVQPIIDVPLWLSKATYEAGTMLGTLGLASTYVAIAGIVAFFVRFAYVPSVSMQPALNPGDVVLVTRNIWPLRPNIGDVVLFDPPSSLNEAIKSSTMIENAVLPSKGDQFLKRVVARDGEKVGVKNSEPFVELASRGDGTVTKKQFRVDIVGPYVQSSIFDEKSWNRPAKPLGRNEYFVVGDNGFRSVDSRVWGPLSGRNIVGTARWILWPLSDFGPVKEGNIYNIEK